MEYIRIGKIINTHGLKGEVKIESYSNFDDLRYVKGNTIYLETEDGFMPLVVSSFRIHKGYPLVSFEQMEDINLIEPYKNHYVCILKSDRHELEEGEYYVDEVIGCEVYDEENHLIGTLISVEETNGAQNNFRVQREGEKDVLIPHVPYFVKEIDIENKIIIVHVEKGLL